MSCFYWFHLVHPYSKPMLYSLCTVLESVTSPTTRVLFIREQGLSARSSQGTEWGGPCVHKVCVCVWTRPHAHVHAGGLVLAVPLSGKGRTGRRRRAQAAGAVDTQGSRPRPGPHHVHHREEIHLPANLRKLTTSIGKRSLYPNMYKSAWKAFFFLVSMWITLSLVFASIDILFRFNSQQFLRTFVIVSGPSRLR